MFAEAQIRVKSLRKQQREQHRPTEPRARHPARRAQVLAASLAGTSFFDSLLLMKRLPGLPRIKAGSRGSRKSSPEPS